ncbi:cytochrome P450 [Amycolatopsis sp. NPDC049252]|uniref:cytochrome P450 n=1 Tax=Amycolatopsis sp. NPDC049252 TaxID=3363933 RepID=UPI0037196805
MTQAPFPQPRECPYQAPPGYLALAERGPLSRVTLFDGREVWLVTGYAAARSLLADRRLSADRTRDGYPLVAPRFRAGVARQLVLIGMDPPVHDDHRRLLNPYFSLRSVRAMRPMVERIVDRYLDHVESLPQPVDLVSAFTTPVPSQVMSEVLGLAEEDLDFFQDASRRLLHATTQEDSQAAGGELIGYLDRLVTLRRTEPGPGLMGELAPAVVAGELTQHELVQIALVLLVAGHDTTASTLAMSVVTLLDHPEQIAALGDEERLPAVAEELLRVLAVTDLAGVRVALEDIEIEGTTVRAGEGVLISATLGNRDASVHDDPHAIRFDRAGRNHLTFGYGIHQCLGQNLARLEVQVALSKLFARLPGLKLAEPAENLPYRAPGTGTVQGVNRLPIFW